MAIINIFQPIDFWSFGLPAVADEVAIDIFRVWAFPKLNSPKYKREAAKFGKFGLSGLWESSR